MNQIMFKIRLISEENSRYFKCQQYFVSYLQKADINKIDIFQCKNEQEIIIYRILSIQPPLSNKTPFLGEDIY